MMETICESPCLLALFQKFLNKWLQLLILPNFPKSWNKGTFSLAHERKWKQPLNAEHLVRKRYLLSKKRVGEELGDGGGFFCHKFNFFHSRTSLCMKHLEVCSRGRKFWRQSEGETCRQGSYSNQLTFQDFSLPPTLMTTPYRRQTFPDALANLLLSPHRW